jgi:hypothetical protein
MAAFDPDKYLAKTAPRQAASGGFDPDAYLAAKKEPEPRGMLRSFADAGADLVEAGGEQAMKLAAPVLEPVARGYDRFVRAPLAKGIEEAGTVGGFKGTHLIPGVQLISGAKGLLGAVKQLFDDPKNAPTVAEALESAGVPKTPGLSALIPDAYSESGRGIQLKKGGLLDPTLADATAFGAESLATAGLGKLAVSGGKGLLGAGKQALTKAPAKAVAAAPGAVRDVTPLVADELAAATKGAPQKVRAGEIAESAKRLVDQEPPSYLLSADPEVAKLANTVLEGPPSLVARGERKKLGKYFEKGTEAGENLRSQAGTLSLDETGDLVKRRIRDRIDERFQPAEDLYSAVEGKYEKLPLNRQSFTRGAAALRRSPEFKFDPGALAMIDDLEGRFAKVKNVGDLKAFRTSIYKSVAQQNLTPSQKNVLNSVYRLATNERGRSIKRAELAGKSGRVQTGRFAGPAEKTEAGTLAQLKQADDLFSAASKDVGEGLGLESKRGYSSRQAATDWLEGTPNEQLVRSLFNRGNAERLRQVKTAFPDEFEVLRQRAVRELVDTASEGAENISTRKLLNSINKLSPEVQEMVLGEQLGTFKDLNNVISAVPKNFNPSSTATKMQWLDWFKGGAADEIPDLLALRKISKKTAAPAAPKRPGLLGPAAFGVSGPGLLRDRGNR